MAEVFETSHLRGNIIAWLPIKQTDHVLLMGEVPAVVEKRLVEKSVYTSCMNRLTEMPPKGQFDYVIRLGEVDDSAIQTCAEYVKEDGFLVLAAENAYGLKYLAGVRDIGSGQYFGAMEGLKESKGTTREALAKGLKKEGFSSVEFYYPFPDYHFTMSLYSDDYQPKQGELIDQIGNFDTERLILFDETRAADVVVARGMFKEFSNAYLVVAAKEKNRMLLNEDGEKISFVKFSNDRGTCHNIRTYITKSADERFHLLKVADTYKASEQITKLLKTKEKLKKLYANSRFHINDCSMRKDSAELEFLSGHTMEEELDDLLEQGNYVEAEAKMAEVFAEIRSCELEEFQVTEAFKQVFGDVTLPENLEAVSVADIDMIFPNILIGEDGKWTIIDYEWSFHFPVPVNFIIFRAIHYYAETTAERRLLDAEKLYLDAGISEEEIDAYRIMEEAFQRHVLEGHIPMRQLYKEVGKPAYHITSLMHIKNEIEHTRMMQVYFDRGNGTREEDCINFHSKSLDGVFHLEIPVDADVTAIRIDPAAQACTAEIERLCFSSSKEKIVPFYGPVHKVGNDIYLFESEDPFLLITELPKGERRLYVDMRVETMSLAAAELISPKIDLKYRIKQMLNK